MSLDKGIEHGKEWRKPYYGSAAFDRSCRPHGDCPWCYGNRIHSMRVRLSQGCSLDDEIEEILNVGKPGEKSPAFLFYDTFIMMHPEMMKYHYFPDANSGRSAA